MRNQQVKRRLSNGASGDISHLAPGSNRADIALNALKEEVLTPEQIDTLKKLADGYENLTETRKVETKDDSTTKETFTLTEIFELTVEDTKFDRKVSFVLLKGMSPRRVLEVLERASPGIPADPRLPADFKIPEGIVRPGSPLLEDDDLDMVVNEDTKFSATICFESNKRTRPQGVSYIERQDLDPTQRWILTVAAALFRIEKGFPSNRSHIGLPVDQGDLFKGTIVRAASGALSSFDTGISSCDSYDDRRIGAVVSAGSPSSN